MIYGRKYGSGLAGLLAALIFVVMPAQAQDKVLLAEMWMAEVKPGTHADFEKKFKDHINERVKLEDPRAWHVYTPVLGEHLNRYLIRYCCFEWKDADSYEQWGMEKHPNKHWNKHVDKYVQRYGHYLEKMDVKNSRWPKGVEANFVGVSHYLVKMGQWEGMKEDMAIISTAAKENNWPYHWSWSFPVSGTPSKQLVIPFKNYADMAPPEQKFSEIMVKHLGSEEKVKAFWQRWSSHFETVEYNIYRYRKDLSMQEKSE